MYRFFVAPDAVGADSICIRGGDVNHIKNVLRLRPGESISVSDGTGREYICSIYKLTGEAVYAKIEDIQGLAAELPVDIYLFQGFPKGDKLEFIIQKAVELGVSKVIPVMTKRSVVKLDGKKADRRQERYQAIAEAAAKQAKRGVIPEVLPVMSFPEALELAKTLDMVLIPYEDAKGIADSRKRIEEVREKKSLGIFIGPEGGFAPAEVESVQAAGGRSITLGRRILRTETAAVAALSVIMFALEDDEGPKRIEHGSIF